MLIQQDKGKHQVKITHYSENQIKINGVAQAYPVAVSPDEVLTLALPDSFERLNESSLEPFLELAPEVFIIGTGNTSKFLPNELESLCAQYQQVVDIMSTDAACRTFTVLAGEGRRVLAIFFEK